MKRFIIRLIINAIALYLAVFFVLLAPNHQVIHLPHHCANLRTFRPNNQHIPLLANQRHWAKIWYWHKHRLPRLLERFPRCCGR